MIAQSPVAGQYDTAVDRESAHEMLAKQAEAKMRAEEDQRRREAEQKEVAQRPRWTLPDGAEAPRERRQPAPRASNRQSVAEAAMKSVVRSVGSSVGRALLRGILGSLKGGR